ncbi:hypothetical protein CCACVL1_00404 [Corchorus capsularis]|uniref:C2H2-type domain-containing protein n=1 Tax=Corchorus capsularis TaxID=210143 RepID=A0A1R3KX41_COCAP|nr:hypothetical protein CCACVL1_00404 [Corchorus capsularis]
MESAGKQGSSDVSSEENERVDQVKGGGDTATTTAKRSYECTFCKRGFTNAQALGGHMNIHRKDRAKAKQPSTSSSSVPIITSDHHQPLMNDQELFMNPSYLTQFPTQVPSNSKYYPILEAQRNNTYDHMYFQPPVSSPRVLQHGNYYDHSNDFVVPAGRTTSSQISLNMNEELLGANLSLQIGPTYVDDDDDSEVRRGFMKEDEIDLELRLGHDPN